jgi:hypothetical protein
MGIDRWTYLGPYAELPLTLKTTRRDMCPEPAQCPNPDPLKSQFCATCGMQTSKRFHEFQAADPPLPDFLFQELNEALFTADGMGGPTRIDAEHVVYRLIGNVAKSDKPREFHLDTDGDLAMDLTTMNMQDEIAWFKRAYAAEFMKVQQTYGGIVFRWGFLRWFS